MRAARGFTRRILLRHSADIGTVAAMGPWVVKDALSSSGVLNVLNRDDELTNGVVIGQTRDGPPISLKKQGKPVSYMAQQEGAITWLDGWSMPMTAKNVEQAYEWLKFVHSAEGPALVAEGSGDNPVAKGADALLSPAAKKIFAEAYPEDALAKIWPRPSESSWLVELRNQYPEKFKAA